MAQMDVQVDIHTVAMGGPAEDTRVVSNGGLGMCPGCDGVLGCTADCPGGVDADAERDARIEEREAEDRAEFEWQMFLATNPELLKPSGCECDELEYDGECNSCLWEERLRDGLLGKDRRCLDCPDCRVYGEECPGCDWK